MADEGMWLPFLLKKLNIDTMRAMGLQLTAEEIYNINTASLKDAIISFNGYCTGEVISKHGLVLTNHHCGYDAIQNISSVENDYLGEGFWAKSFEEEIPNENLFVDFLIKMEDVSEEILEGISISTNEEERNRLIKERIEVIKKREQEKSNYRVEIKDFYHGGEYYMSLYERYSDVRLVGTPPESIGKFGGDTDNWMWPRHTGDFALFRIYTDPDGNPSTYNEDNIPLSPKHYLPISLDGVEENDFAMILGYPGSTDRYLSSFGVDMAINLYNPAVVEVRDAKLNILNQYMKSDRSISLMYASKKARISNYWKYYIGQTKGLKKLNVEQKKRELEESFSKWVGMKEERKIIYGDVLNRMEKAYEEMEKHTLSRVYLNEAAWSGPSFIKLARRAEKLLSALDSKNDSTILAAKKVFKKQVVENFEEYDQRIEKDIFIKMMQMYYNNVESTQLPSILKEMGEKYETAGKINDGGFEKWADQVYNRSIFVDRQKMLNFLDGPATAKTILKDPAYIIQKSILDNYFTKTLPAIQNPQKALDIANRLFVDGLRQLYPEKLFYPNANFTLRATYGTVGSYSPGNGVQYDFSTTLEGVVEKMDQTNPEFIVPKKLMELWKNKDFDIYANDDGELNVCFISNNDITGGNSGSPVINKNGHLIGCAFDGNWEAMSGDIAFENKLQRTISVDVRYILFIIDKFANAKNIIDELTLVKISEEERLEKEKEETIRVVENIKNLIDEFPEIIEEKCKNLNKVGKVSFSETFLKSRQMGLEFFEWEGQVYTTELLEK